MEDVREFVRKGSTGPNAALSPLSPLSLTLSVLLGDENVLKNLVGICKSESNITMGICKYLADFREHSRTIKADENPRKKHIFVLLQKMVSFPLDTRNSQTKSWFLSRFFHCFFTVFARSGNPHGNLGQ